MPDDSDFEELSPAETAALVESGDAELVDVRTGDEYEAGHIEGARHIPLEDLTEREGELPRDRPVIFYCLGGNRSAMAAAALAASGGDARKLDGGIRAWADEDRPLEPEGGEVAEPGAMPPR